MSLPLFIQTDRVVSRRQERISLETGKFRSFYGRFAKCRRELFLRHLRYFDGCEDRNFSPKQRAGREFRNYGRIFSCIQRACSLADVASEERSRLSVGQSGQIALCAGPWSAVFDGKIVQTSSGIDQSIFKQGACGAGLSAFSASGAMACGRAGGAGLQTAAVGAKAVAALLER